MEVRKKKIFYSEDEALACQAQHEGAEIDFREGHGVMLNGEWTYDIPENRPSWTVSFSGSMRHLRQASFPWLCFHLR